MMYIIANSSQVELASYNLASHFRLIRCFKSEGKENSLRKSEKSQITTINSEYRAQIIKKNHLFRINGYEGNTLRMKVYRVTYLGSCKL